MAPDQTSEVSPEVEQLRDHLDALERERAEEVAKAHAAVAEAQDRSYWLDRWQLDLNALMRRPGAGLLRAALRALRALYRLSYEARDRAGGAAAATRGRLAAARAKVDRERADSAAHGPQASERGLTHTRTLSPDGLGVGPVTELLHARLTEQDISAIEGRLASPEAAALETADPLDRKRLRLAFAAHYEVEEALQRTGLRADMPPPGVHTMAQGPMAAGGSYYYADLVADALRESGAELAPGQAVLDFGCSSGRVVRVLAAALPALEWHGCDPIPDAIDWASAQLPEVAFERSPEHPPLAYADASFDCVYAISIWSHFAEQAALDWLAEMRRILKPGGRLLLTTHGEQTVAHTHRFGLRSTEQLADVQSALFERGFWYAPEFGEQGDHGVANADWGTAFVSPEWLLTHVTPDWRVLFYRPGRVEGDQDLYVLERA